MLKVSLFFKIKMCDQAKCDIYYIHFSFESNLIKIINISLLTEL